MFLKQIRPFLKPAIHYQNPKMTPRTWIQSLTICQTAFTPSLRHHSSMDHFVFASSDANQLGSVASTVNPWPSLTAYSCSSWASFLVGHLHFITMEGILQTWKLCDVYGKMCKSNGVDSFLAGHRRFIILEIAAQAYKEWNVDQKVYRIVHCR